MKRRTFVQASSLSVLGLSAVATIAREHATIAQKVNAIANGRDVKLTLMYPAGCLANLQPALKEFERLTSVRFELVEVPLDEINDEILIEAEARKGAFDIALPATFGLPDLVEAGILVNLDKYATVYEPADFQKDSLFSVGDYYKGSLYGYQADGDTYMMFYVKSWLENADEQKKFADQYGYPLAIPKTWAELDQMMAFFHRPKEGMYGGALFRTEYFVAWEWWIRFHAKGLYPLKDDLTPQIDSAEGILALEEMVAASKFLHPGSASNQLFENFEEFGRGHTFCNIGWGGTQKYLTGPDSKLKGNVVYGPTPGGNVRGKHVDTPYFNWGWNYVVSTTSTEPEIAYLFTLFASTPELSTRSVREADGYFDPFRQRHYADKEIQRTYTKEFLHAHELSMRKSIPDFYMKGQVEYFDELRLNIMAALGREKSPKQALTDAARAWEQITERMGHRSQRVQWAYLKSNYPPEARQILQ